jgi:hypothetical protein
MAVAGQHKSEMDTTTSIKSTETAMLEKIFFIGIPF